MQLFKKYILTIEAAIIFGFFILFVITAPYTVQSGDTGELVTNSYFLRVIHPPGYPLWSLLYHIPVKYFSFLNPFYSAALFTSLITGTWMGLLLFNFRNVASRCLVLILGTSLIFWRYAVLPDVFSLHLLFLVLVFMVFFEPKLLNKPWMIFLVSLSVAHHHTILFAFPMYLYAVIKNPTRKIILYSLLFGLLSFSIYFLMPLFHADEYGSWGNLNSFSTVMDHFLRTEYGTFSLTAKKDSSDPVWIQLLIKNIILNSWSLVLAIFYSLFREWKKFKGFFKPFAIIGLCLFSYLLTFLIGGVISLNGFGETIFERFLLQPTLMLFFIVFFIINRIGIEFPKWLFMAFLINAGLNLTQNFSLNDYSDNTIIEDFALNILNTLPEKSIYYSYGDTQGSAAYYLHDVLKIRPDVIQFHPTLPLHWSARKAEKKFAHAYDADKSKIIEGMNLNDFTLFMNIPPTELPEHYKASFYGIVFKVTKDSEKTPPIGYECEISKNFKWRNRSELEDFSSFEVSRFYDLEYGRCDYVYGLEMLKAQNLEGAIQFLEKSMDLSPFSAKFLERLCYVYKLKADPKLEACNEKLEELIAVSNKQYYLYQYEN